MSRVRSGAPLLPLLVLACVLAAFPSFSATRSSSI